MRVVPHAEQFDAGRVDSEHRTDLIVRRYFEYIQRREHFHGEGEGVVGPGAAEGSHSVGQSASVGADGVEGGEIVHHAGEVVLDLAGVVAAIVGNAESIVARTGDRDRVATHRIKATSRI